MADETGAALELDWLTARPISHRGLHDISQGIVENTASAFAAAIMHDYAIECDLRVSCDGEAMVFHDADLEHLTTANGPVNECTAGALQKIEIKQSKDHMQTLQELLVQVDDQVPLVIELKSTWDDSRALPERACAVLENYLGRFGLMSFDPFVVETIKDIAPQFPRGLVAGCFKPEKWPGANLELLEYLRSDVPMKRAQPHFISLKLDALNNDRARQFRAAGGPVICWTVTSREIADQCYELCDQITFEGFRA